MLLKNGSKKRIESVFDFIKNCCDNSSDLKTRIIVKNNNRIGYMFLESVSSDDKISNFLNKSIINLNKKNLFDSFYDNIKNSIYNSNITKCSKIEELFYFLSNGFTIIVLDNCDNFIAIETRAQLDRGVVESTSEPIVRGPKDSFTENHQKNIGLIRKRIKDFNLIFSDSIVGRRTKTKVTISYIKDIANLKNVEILKKTIENIDIDGILDSGYIREFLEKKSISLFPKVISTERPDLACSSLLNGKIVLLVENTPFVLIMPAVLTDFIHSPEDNYQKSLNATFSRILRFLCFFITTLTPAIYIALVTFNQEIIPDQLLISLARQRESVPFPTGIEVLLFVLIFEILREADIHSPSISGSAMNIVGALILGDAAVNAGLVSPIVIIIVAVTSITELVFFDVDMINALREWRIIYIIFSIVLGMVGVMVGFIIFITKLASLESMGVPYLTPISPLKTNQLKDSITRFKRTKLKFRPDYITNNIRKLGDQNEKNNL